MKILFSLLSGLKNFRSFTFLLFFYVFFFVKLARADLDIKIDVWQEL